MRISATIANAAALLSYLALWVALVGLVGLVGFAGFLLTGLVILLISHNVDLDDRSAIHALGAKPWLVGLRAGSLVDWGWVGAVSKAHATPTRLMDHVMSNLDDIAVHRRLSVLLFADIADYTRLMGEDEIGTWRAAKERILIFRQLAQEFGGEVLQVRGDGLFLLFGSATTAVSYAMTIQKKMQAFNHGLPDDRQLLFRIGINLGEVLFGDGEVAGDSVNIASRIESYARPGQVCISASVYDQVCNKLAFSYSYQGAQHFKNVREAVGIFEVCEDAAAAALTPGLRRTNDHFGRFALAESVEAASLRILAHCKPERLSFSYKSVK